MSIGYYIYALTQNPSIKERETFLSELGEGFGELALYALLFIYLRTLLKLLLGKGPLSKRLLPEYTPPPQASILKKWVTTLDRTHVHVGIATSAIILLHVALMGAPMSNLFFPAVLALIAWQSLFGWFLRWRVTPRDVKKFSLAVHAQLFTGIALGIFAYLGHALIDS